jgi:hypothetical protein
MQTPIRSAALVVALAAVAQQAAAQNLDKLSIHGYLTQGYAVSDSALVEGIPKEGTTDYRRAALLMRYATTEHDNFVLQIAHRRLGNSPSMQFESDVKVDWAFFEHSFGPGTRLRVGKAPIPLGIYNETRYVGTQLPFYRAPYAMYHEGIYTSESVDGVSLMQPIMASSSWAMEASAYAGSFSYLDFLTARTGATTFAYVGQREKASGVLGGQLWISTPIDGLRIGGGGSRYTVANAFFQPGKFSFDGWNAAVDGKFERFFSRSEFRRINAHKLMGYNSWYTQGGLSLTSKLSVNAQAERANYTVPPIPAVTAGYKVDLVKDDAAGLTYAFTPGLMLKVEGHKTKGHNIESVLPPTSPSVEGKYFISSLSVVF